MTSAAVLDASEIVDEAEIVVVGAGPAGSRCAARLAAHGHDVLLVDKSVFPREKPCGDGVTDMSVRVLEELGLDTLLEDSQQIEGLRTFFDHEPETRSFRRRSARCISRFALDQGLLDAALERGGRFAQTRVDGPLMDGETVVGVSATGGGILARCVVAADGATSRLRRGCGFTPLAADRRAYAVRQYFRSERPLSPYFEIYVPLLHRSTELLGYGWVFPLDEHTANVGVGYYRHGPAANSPPLTAVLEAFVEELALLEGDRYGTLEPIGRPFGSPVGVGFTRERCQFQRILFVGDAAQMTDPLTGEGIGNALYGGGLVADVAHSALTRSRGGDWHLDLSLGRELDRRMLPLGQDTDVLRRVAARRLARPGDHSTPRRTGVRSEPFLSATAYAVASPHEPPALHDTPIASFVARYDDEVVKAIDLLNEKALDELLTRFPFVPETLHLRLRADAGPTASVMTLLAARTGERRADSTVVSAALGVEFLAMFPVFVSQTVNRPNGGAAKLNNTFAILVADYVVSRALSCGAPAGATITGAIARTGCAMCEAEAIERADRGDIGPSERYLEAARLRDGSLFALATSAGGLLAGYPQEAVAALGRYGRPLGVAFRISNDICDLLADDEATRAKTERRLQDGRYSLPVIEALSHDELEPGWLEGGLDRTVSAIRRSGGLERALVECEAMAGTARDAIASIGANGAMADLCDLPAERARSALRVLDQPRVPLV